MLTTLDKVGIGLGIAAVVGGGTYLVVNAATSTAKDGGKKPPANPDAKNPPTGDFLSNTINTVSGLWQGVQTVETIFDKVGDMFADF